MQVVRPCQTYGYEELLGRCYFIDSHSVQYVGCSKQGDLLDFQDFDIVWYTELLRAFLDKPLSSYYHWRCFGLHTPHPTYFYPKIFVFRQILYNSHGGVIFR